MARLQIGPRSIVRAALPCAQAATWAWARNSTHSAPPAPLRLGQLSTQRALAVDLESDDGAWISGEQNRSAPAPPATLVHLLSSLSLVSRPLSRAAQASAAASMVVVGVGEEGSHRSKSGSPSSSSFLFPFPFSSSVP